MSYHKCHALKCNYHEIKCPAMKCHIIKSHEISHQYLMVLSIHFTNMLYTVLTISIDVVIRQSIYCEYLVSIMQLNCHS